MSRTTRSKRSRGGFGQKFFRERNVLLARETEAVDDPGDFRLGLLNALGNLHLLLARQQGHLPHLVQIHPHRVVQNVHREVSSLLAFGFLDVIHLGLVNNFNFERPELGKNFVQLFRRRLAFGQHLVNVVESQLPLLLRQADEFLDFFRKIVVEPPGGTTGRSFGAMTAAALRFPFFGEASGPVLRTFVLDIQLQSTLPNHEKKAAANMVTRFHFVQRRNMPHYFRGAI